MTFCVLIYLKNDMHILFSIMTCSKNFCCGSLCTFNPIGLQSQQSGR